MLSPREIDIIVIRCLHPNILRVFLELGEQHLMIILSAISHLLNTLLPSLKLPLILLISIRFF